MNNLIIKKFLAYLFLFFGLGFVFISNSYSADVKFIKCKLYESETDYYTTFEIDLKKNDVYRIFFAEGDLFYKYIKLDKNDDAEAITKIIPWGTKKNQFKRYEFNKETNDVYEMLFKDKFGKNRSSKVKMLCDDVVGNWKDQIITTAKKNWITKKKSTNKKEIEKIEKMYADGFLTKADCVKAKSKLLKIPKISKTICDNVKVKVAKKEEKTDLDKQVDEIKKQLEVFKKKEKDLSKDTKSWITKKKKEKKKTIVKEKHYNSLAEFPISEFYYYAIDENEREIIGYANQDANSKYMEVENRKFRKGSEGKAYIVNSKVTCDVYSEVDKAKSSGVYMGNVTMICSDNQQFIGGWIQNGENGKGIATSENGKNSFEFIFSMNRDTAIATASKEPPKETTIAKKPNSNEDKTNPVIKVAKKIESSGFSILQGVVTDDSDEVFLIVDGNRINVDNKGNFKIPVDATKKKLVVLEAYDGSGNDITENIKIVLIADRPTTNEKYYALIIGNNKYHHLEPLDAAENDAKVLANILENKYDFEVTYKPNADHDTIKDTMYSLARKLKKKDNLLIYYAGHGHLDEKEGKGYWLPVDASMDKPSKWVSNSFVSDQAKATEAKHVLLIVDSCFSGSLTKTRSTGTKKITEDQMKDREYLKDLQNSTTRLVITSGGVSPVLDSVGGEHSLFAEKLIKTLKENNGVVNTSQIFENIRKYVSVNSKSLGIKQVPERKVLLHFMDEGGDFLFFSKN